jgi:pimeloyl-ACP methyl ester carboxylesterase
MTGAQQSHISLPHYFHKESGVWWHLAASWENPDFVDIVIHSYRHRWKNAIGDDRYEKMEKQLKDKPEIEVPTIFLQGDEDGASLPDASLRKERFYTGHYERRVILGAGHFIQREKPAAVIEAIADIAAMTNPK